MKRDMDLVRDLLLKIEGHPGLNRVAQYQFGPGDIGITEENHTAVAFHLDLMIEAGLVQGNSAMRMPIVSGLTWQGHEFLDAIRDDGIWKKTKEGASRIGGWTVPIITELAKGYLKAKARELGIPVGS